MICMIRKKTINFSGLFVVVGVTLFGYILLFSVIQ